MPIQISIDSAHKRIHANLSGVVSFAEMANAINSVVDDPLFFSGMNILSDHTDREKPISTSTARALATHIEKLKERFSNSRWAVVTNKEASYGMMRMLSVFLEKIPMELHVFYSKEEADVWLSGTEKKSP